MIVLLDYTFGAFIDPPILYNPVLDPSRTYRVRLMQCQTEIGAAVVVPFAEIVAGAVTSPVAQAAFVQMEGLQRRADNRLLDPAGTLFYQSMTLTPPAPQAPIRHRIFVPPTSTAPRTPAQVIPSGSITASSHITVNVPTLAARVTFRRVQFASGISGPSVFFLQQS